MPTLTTQSIGVVGAQITANTYPAAQARASEASTQSGVQRAQNQARAVSSATKAQGDKNRSVQEEKRAEGVFADHEEGSERHGDTTQQKRTGFNRIA